MEYFVYYDDSGKKTIRSFGDDSESASSFCKSMLDVDPFEEAVYCQDFINIVWYHPELYNGPVLVICRVFEDKDIHYYQAAHEFLDLVCAQETSGRKLSPWYTKENEWPMS